MLKNSTFDDLILEQDRLRLQSLRNLENLRNRQDKYRSCRLSGHRLPDQSNVSSRAGSANTSFSEHRVFSGEGKTSVDGNQLCCKPVTTVSRSTFSDGLLNSSSKSKAFQFSQLPTDSQKHIMVRHSTSAVLSDDLQSEKWSASATQAARKKLINGRVHSQRNVNNSSSVDTHNGSRLFELVSTSGKYADFNGSKSLDTDSAGYFASGDASTDQHNFSRTPQKLEQSSLEGTPKSILRHRQIIDRNVHVESKFDHTPTTNVCNRKHRRGLNFSYSDVDDAQLFGRKTKSVNFDVGSKKSTSASNSQAVQSSNQPSESQDEIQLKSLASSSLADDTMPSSQRFFYAPDATDCSENSVDPRGSSTARNIASKGLLLQAGNDRQNAKIVRELENRSRSVLFSSDQPIMNRSTTASQSQVLKNYVLYICFILCASTTIRTALKDCIFWLYCLLVCPCLF